MGKIYRNPITYKGKNVIPTDINGKKIYLENENFVYDGTNLNFTTTYKIKTIISVDFDGLIQTEDVNYMISNTNEIVLLETPLENTKIGVTYFR